MIGRRAVVVALLAVAAFVPAATLRAQSVAAVFPLEPADDAIAGPKPIFRVGVEGSDLGKMRFRVVVSDDDFESAAYVFDQVADPAGWSLAVLGGESGALYRAVKPLAEGDYRWRAEAWNGVDWVRGDRTFRLRIDATPPADVADVRMSRVRDGLRFEWSPVVVDREGRSEVVVGYRVYRYAKRSFFFVIRAFEVASLEGTTWTETDPAALAAPMLFYKITAVDAAGNEPERRY